MREIAGLQRSLRVTEEPYMSGLGDWREYPRVDVNGEAFWSAERLEGSCQVLNLSLGGAAIADPTPALAVGTVLSFSIKIERSVIATIRSEVVRTDTDQLALRFLKLSDEQRASVESVLAR